VLKATFHRGLVVCLLAVLTVTLTSLGVRLPWSAGFTSSTGKPKPRPRAIIKNQIKVCKQVIKELPASAALPVDSFRVHPTRLSSGLVPIQLPVRTTSSICSLSPARASPTSTPEAC
jgi:hypothetical protein